MSNFEIGDMVVLISGSMRMAVESIDEETVSVVWCHEGKVGRDTFPAKLLNKWENRGGDDRGGFGGRGGDRGGFNKGGDRGGFNKGGDRGGWRDRDNDRGGDRGGWKGRDGGDRGGWNNDRGGDRGGWNNDRGGDRGYDGRPREKKYFRKGGDE